MESGTDNVVVFPGRSNLYSLCIADALVARDDHGIVEHLRTRMPCERAHYFPRARYGTLEQAAQGAPLVSAPAAICVNPENGPVIEDRLKHTFLIWPRTSKAPRPLYPWCGNIAMMLAITPQFLDDGKVSERLISSAVQFSFDENPWHTSAVFAPERGTFRAELPPFDFYWGLEIGTPKGPLLLSYISARDIVLNPRDMQAYLNAIVQKS